MFERATASALILAALCSAVALAVFAGGFAVYAFAGAWLPPAGAAAVVTALAALLAAACAWAMKARADRQRLEALEEQARLMDALPNEAAGFLTDRPLVALAASLLGGVLAARSPNLVREVLAAFRVHNRRS